MKKLLKRLLLVAVIAVIVLNWTWGRIGKQPPVPYGKFATVGETRIHYVETPGKDPAVVMIHGLPGTWGDWNLVTPHLKGRHTIAIDRPGYAYSTGGYMPFDQQLTTIHAFTQKLGLKDPVIAGHSYGGTIALAYARKYPREVHSLVLVDPGVDPDGKSTFDQIQARFVRFLQVPVIKQVADATFSQVTRTVSADTGDALAFDPEQVNPGHKKRLLELNMQSEDLKAYSNELLASQDVIDSLVPTFPSITTQAWVLQGDQDKRVSPAAVKQMASQLPNARLKMVSGGHMVPYVHPTDVAAAIAAAAR